MLIDGDRVEKGDRVWHDRYGWGLVTYVSGGTCYVSFSDSDNEVIFTEGGMSNDRKVLWWAEPVRVVPRKGKDYSGIRKIVEVLVNVLGV